MSPNDFLESKGYGKEGFVTRSRAKICELLKEYEQMERTIAWEVGYNTGIEEAAECAEVEITYFPNNEVGKMPEIKSCVVNKHSILKLKIEP